MEEPKMRKALTALSLAAALAVLAGPGVAQAQSYPPSGESLTVSDSVVVPGESITISGGGADPGATVTFVFHSDPITLGSTTANSSGHFSATFAVPSGASAGTHTITAVSGGVTLTSLSVVVSASGGSGGSSASG